jgi:glycosyltransferase involved in cell wall biosynthesis
MKNEKTLVILIPGFASSEEDSTCLPAQQSFIRRLNKDHPLLNIQILAFQYPYYSSSYYWNNNQVHAFGGKNRGGLSRRLLWWSVNQKLNNLRNDHNITGVLSFWCGECAYIGKKWADKNKVKHFIWLMGQDAKKENAFVGKIKPTSEELIAISDFTNDEFYKNHGVKPAHTIPLGVEPSEFPPALTNKDIDILCAGSLILLKQFDIAIRVMKEIVNKKPDARMIICGKGPEENNLKELIKGLGLEKNVKLTGELAHSDLLKLMSRTKVFLHPSSFEGFSGVCLEAIGAGADVVSFHRPMRVDIVNWNVVKTIKEMNDKINEIWVNTLLPKFQYPHTAQKSVYILSNLLNGQINSNH